MEPSEADIPADAAWVAVGLVVVGSLGGAVVLAEWPIWGVADDTDGTHLVEPSEGGTELWPYTASARDYGTRTLGINVVFYGDPDEIHTVLTERSAFEWEDEQLHEGDADAETVSTDRINVNPEADDIGDVISWGNAEGSTRYTYFEVDGEGQWVDESYQLHAGTYLGERKHIRAYDDPAAEWTAVQIHDEHWDWFRLRHTVTGISESQRALEGDFMGQPDTQRVVRMPFDNPTVDSDGWVSGIHLVGGLVPLLAVGLVGRTRRATQVGKRFLRGRRREIALGASLFAVYTAVRWLGVAGELAFPDVSPKIVAAPLFVALVAGIPAIAYRLGRGSAEAWAFTFAALGLGAAIVVDYAAMGTTVLPLRVVLHRGAVLLSIGLIALGGAHSVGTGRSTPAIVGAFGWGLAIALSLFGYI